MLCIDTLSKLVFCWGFPSHHMVVVVSRFSVSIWWLKKCHANNIHPTGCSKYSHDFTACFDHATCFQTLQTVVWYVFYLVDTSARLLLKIAMRSTRSNSNANVCAVAVVHTGSMHFYKYVQMAVVHLTMAQLASWKMSVVHMSIVHVREHRMERLLLLGKTWTNHFNVVLN